MNQTDSYFSRKIIFLNTILTFMIVLHHATPNLRFGLPLDRSTPIIYGLRYLTETAVPLFFFISGMLFYCRCSRSEIKSKIKRRSKSLLLPYILWNTLFFAIYWILSHWEVTASRMNMSEIPNGIVDITRGILDSKFTPLWFVKNLIIYTLLAPLIYFLIHTRILAWLSLIVSTIIGVSFDFSYENALVWLPIYLQGAIAGKYFYSDMSNQRSDAISHLCNKKRNRLIIKNSLIISFIIIYCMVMFHSDYLIIYRYITPILLWMITDLVAANYLENSFEVKKWMGYTFFIYCTHYFILNIMQKLAVLNFEPTEFLLTALMIITPVITIVFLIFLASKLSNCKIYKVLTGGRGI